MRRWNGWGDDAVQAPVGAGLRALLEGALGPGAPPRDAGWEEALAQVPPARLPAHPLVSSAPEDRLRHAGGQAFHDLVAARSGRFPALPDGVARPASAAQVRTLLAWARGVGAKVIPWGGGTSVVGHVNPRPSDGPVLTLDLGRLRQLEHLDEADRLATFGAGVAGPDLEAQLRARGYTLGHFPQSFELSTLGGWIATRSRGQQSLGYGRIEELFAGGHVETPAGPLALAPHPSTSAGPDLRELVLGSEGRLGVITQAVVRVSPLPARETVAALLFPSWEAALGCARALAQDGPPLSMLRLSAPEETATLFALSLSAGARPLAERSLGLFGFGDGKSLLLLAASGSAGQVGAAVAEATARAMGAGALPVPRLGATWRRSRFKSPYLRNALWELGYGVETVETAAPWSRLEPLRAELEGALRGALAPFGEPVHVFTHLSHLYSSGANLYTSFLFRLGADAEATLARWRALKQAACEAIVRQGATISHQHGVGLDHKAYLEAEKGALGLQALRGALAAFDPDGLLNPGKLL